MEKHWQGKEDRLLSKLEESQRRFLTNKNHLLEIRAGRVFEHEEEVILLIILVNIMNTNTESKEKRRVRSDL